MKSLIFVFLFAACDDSPILEMADAGPRCVPGASVACACVSGAMGAQICKSDGTFDVCVCASTTSNGGGTTSTGGGTTSTGGGTTSTGGGTTSTGGGTTSTGGGTTTPSDCGHPMAVNWCNGTHVEHCGPNGAVIVDSRCEGYNEDCATGHIGGNGDQANWHESQCGTQCPVANDSPNVVYYCEGNTLWECGGFLAVKLIDCGTMKCVAGKSSCQ